MKKINWVTEGDNKICDICDENALAGPYLSDYPAMPDMPAQPNCRCHWNLNADLSELVNVIA